MMANVCDIPPAETLEEANRQRDHWIEVAAQHHRNEIYYRGLIDRVGELLGEEVRTQDNGNVLPEGEILRAIVPEIVFRRLALNERFYERKDFLIDQIDKTVHTLLEPMMSTSEKALLDKIHSDVHDLAALLSSNPEISNSTVSENTVELG